MVRPTSRAALPACGAALPHMGSQSTDRFETKRRELRVLGRRSRKGRSTWDTVSGVQVPAYTVGYSGVPSGLTWSRRQCGPCSRLLARIAGACDSERHRQRETSRDTDSERHQDRETVRDADTEGERQARPSEEKVIRE
eukprot:3442084-Rhodomonas_salina.1